MLNCIHKVPLGIRPFEDRSTKRLHHIDIDLISIVRLVFLEPRREVVSMGKDLFESTWHRHHLRIFSRARIAWTMTIAVAPWI